MPTEPEILPRPKRTALTDLYQTSEFKRAWKEETEVTEPMTAEQWAALKAALMTAQAGPTAAERMMVIVWKALPAILAYHERAENRIAELRAIIDNVATALYPNSTKQQQLAEMLLDGGGAVDTIQNLRLAVQQAEEVWRTAERLDASAKALGVGFHGLLGPELRDLRAALGGVK